MWSRPGPQGVGHHDGAGRVAALSGQVLAPASSLGRWMLGWVRGASWRQTLCWRHHVLTRRGRGRVGQETGQLKPEATASASETEARRLVPPSRASWRLSASQASWAWPVPGPRAPPAPAARAGASGSAAHAQSWRQQHLLTRPRVARNSGGTRPTRPPRRAPSRRLAPPRPACSVLLSEAAGWPRRPWGVPC